MQRIYKVLVAYVVLMKCTRCDQSLEQLIFSLLFYFLQISCSTYPICSSKNVFPVFCFAIMPLLKNFILPYFTCSEKVVAFKIYPSNESQEKSKNINLLFSQLYVKIFLLILRREESIFVESNTI